MHDFIEEHFFGFVLEHGIVGVVGMIGGDLAMIYFIVDK